MHYGFRLLVYIGSTFSDELPVILRRKNSFVGGVSAQFVWQSAVQNSPQGSVSSGGSLSPGHMGLDTNTSGSNFGSTGEKFFRYRVRVECVTLLSSKKGGHVRLSKFPINENEFSSKLRLCRRIYSFEPKLFFR